MNNCLFVPSLVRNLISIPVLDKEGFLFHFGNSICIIEKDNKVICQGNLMNNLYELDPSEVPVNVISAKRKRLEDNPAQLWHARLGHISLRRMNELAREGLFSMDDVNSLQACESCLKGKMSKLPFKGQMERAEGLLDLIHTDVCGPLSVSARGGFNYFITFTDDYSRYGYVYLMKYKSEAFEKFKDFRNEVEKQLGRSIKKLRSDRGGEYLSVEFIDYLKEHGILSQWTPPGTPQLNGVSERRNRTLLDMVRSMMGYTQLPAYLWGHALRTAAYLLNRVNTKAVKSTPYELWHSRKPTFKHIRIWGCPAYVKRLMGDKLDARSDLCYFVGYPEDSFGYEFYYVSEAKVFVSRNATFLEWEFLRDRKGSMVELEEVREPQEEVQAHEQINEPIQTTTDIPPKPTVRRSERVRKAPDRLFLLENDIDPVDLGRDPRTFSEAVQDTDKGHWLTAMKSEMDSMYSNKVWTLVDPPKGIVPIGCKWIYKRKIGADGKVSTYKARLVAKGYTQRQGVDYEETFSPVAMLKSIRILLAISAYHDYEIWQMDVKTAFLNGDIEEEIYMSQPEGFISTGDEQKVCKLQRSIYGLKQASRSWNKRFDSTIKEFDFEKNPEEPCIYKKVSGSAVTFLVLYVDDILLIGNDVGMLQTTKAWLSTRFSMKDLGEASYVLGIRIYRDRSRRLLGLSQSLYIETVMKRFSMEESKKGFLPMSHGVRLSKSMCPRTPQEIEEMKRTPYASAIGSIMYGMLCTRPDIAYAVSVTSRYQSNPGPAHWKAVKDILKYLRRTKDMFLVYGSADLNLEGFTDSSFQSDVDDSKSTSGFVYMLNGGAVCWKSSKQNTTADSTTEAEYVAASEAAKEGVWLRNFIQELGVVPNASDPVPLYCDNTGAVAQAKEPRSHQKSKHIQRKYHIIRDIIDRGEVRVERVTSEDNIADPFTKPLSGSVHEKHRESMGLRLMNSWL